MAEGSRHGRVARTERPVGSLKILFVESPVDSGRIFANKPRLVAPFYDLYIYFWVYLVLWIVTHYGACRVSHFTGVAPVH